MIREAEEAFERQLEELARRIRAERPRLIAIAGPSSSGKTSTAHRLAELLSTLNPLPGEREAHPFVTRPLSLDDYFVNRTETPTDANGKYDYESLYALRLDRLHSDLASLLRGEDTLLPAYDFSTGKAGESGHSLKLAPDEALLIEGLHALNPELAGNVKESDIFRIYVAPGNGETGEIRSDELRLLRRLIRDARTRGASPQATLNRWPSVRAGEQTWIDPFVPLADSRLDTRLEYEVPILRDLALPLLIQGELAAHMPSGMEKLPDKLSRIPDQAAPHSEIPAESILREFIGSDLP